MSDKALPQISMNHIYILWMIHYGLKADYCLFVMRHVNVSLVALLALPESNFPGPYKHNHDTNTNNYKYNDNTSMLYSHKQLELF